MCQPIFHRILLDGTLDGRRNCFFFLAPVTGFPVISCTAFKLALWVNFSLCSIFLMVITVSQGIQQISELSSAWQRSRRSARPLPGSWFGFPARPNGTFHPYEVGGLVADTPRRNTALISTSIGYCNSFQGKQPLVRQFQSAWRIPRGID